MRFRFLWLVLVLGFLPMPCRAADDALTIELGELAKEFAKIIEKKGGGSVAVGEFSASSDVKASAGSRIQLTLVAALQSLKLTVDAEDYRFEIKGDYQPLVDRETNLLGIKVVGRLIDRETGEPLAEKPTGRFVFGAETVPEMVGLNLHSSPTTDPVELSDRFKEARKNPDTHVQGTRISTAPDCPFAVEVLVKTGTGYVAREVDLKKGLPFVPLNPEELYGVRLINNADHEAAVELRIDGVSCFEFSEVAPGQKKPAYWILKPKSHLDIMGWHKNNDTSIEFKVVVDFPKTAAAKLNLKPSATIGLITASFSACWADEKDRPADEQMLPTRGTGFGSEISVKTEKVSRTIGLPRDTISVRYER